MRGPDRHSASNLDSVPHVNICAPRRFCHVRTTNFPSGIEMPSATLVWIRRDLRLEDHPALHAAALRGEPVIPVYIHAPDEESPWQPGEASAWWLHQSLHAFDQQLRRIGSRLILRRGNSLAELRKLLDETGAGAVAWNRLYEPARIACDTRIKAELRQAGVTVASHGGHLLFEPWEVSTKEGRPFQVFTAFWRACQALPVSPPLPAPKTLPSPPDWPESLSLDQFHLEPTRPWIQGLSEAFEPGEVSARRQLERFLDDAVTGYATLRDHPARTGTSRLSPHLHFGEISPRTVWSAVQRSRSSAAGDTGGADTFLKEVGWREFAHHLLFHFPTTIDQPLRSEFAAFPWDDNPQALRAWQRGRTGYPIVDAGMRELWTTGWMHNRVRMIVASFLVKDLRLHWRHGAAWFWDTLVDADLANNTLGWQWSAGCGADAAPYFRVFNPVLQSAKFDPDGAYLDRWVPELSRLPLKWRHAPWTAPRDVLTSARIRLGVDYPEPIVDHGEARTKALNAFAALRPSR